MKQAINCLKHNAHYHMTRTAPLAQSYRKPQGKLTCVGPEKAVRPRTRTENENIYCETKFADSKQTGI